MAASNKIFKLICFAFVVGFYVVMYFNISFSWVMLYTDYCRGLNLNLTINSIVILTAIPYTVGMLTGNKELLLPFIIGGAYLVVACAVFVLFTMIEALAYYDSYEFFRLNATKIGAFWYLTIMVGPVAVGLTVHQYLQLTKKSKTETILQHYVIRRYLKVFEPMH